MPGQDVSDLVIRLQADTTKLRKDLSRAKRQMSGFGKFTGGFAKDFTRQITGMFGAFAVIAAGGFVVRSLAGFEHQMAKVKAVSGATEDEFKQLQNSAIQLGRVSQFTSTQIAEMQVSLARIGFTTPEILASADAVRKLATVADTELAPAAEVMAFTLKQFNLDANESERVANVMAESFSKTAFNLERFQTSMANVGPTANAIGVSLEKTTAILGTLVDNGIDASKAGTDLRKIFTEMKLKGLSLDEALIKIRDSEDKVSTAFELFGQRAQTSAIVLSQNIEKFKELDIVLSDTTMELDGQVDIMEGTLLASWKKFQSAIDGLIQSRSGIAGFFKDVVDGGTIFLNWLGQVPDRMPFASHWINENEELVESFRLLKNDMEANLNVTAKLGLIKKQLVDLNSQEGNSNIELRSTLKDLRRGLVGLTSDLDVNSETHKKAVEVHKELTAAISRQTKTEIDYNAIVAKNAKTKADDAEAERIRLAAINKVNAAFRDRKRLLDGLSELAGGVSIGAIDVEVPKLPVPEIDKEAFSRLRFEYTDEMMRVMDAAVQMNDQFKSVIVGTISDAISSATEGLVSNGLKGAFDAVLGVIAGGLVQLGNALIAYGITMKLANKALANPFTSAGAAITAGVIAVAAGTLLKGAMSGGVSGGGGGGGGGGSTGFRNESIGGISIPSEIELVASGDSLRGVIRTGERNDFRNRAN